MEKKQLLTDEQVMGFITQGYLVLENDLSPSFHRSILEQISTVFAEEGNPGNNILPRIPDLDQIFETSTVRGALTSLLGENYYMHPHRHGHHNRPGQAVAQGWHKDGYWSSMRSHRPWWAILFYYTQDVTEEMGPTEIMPGSQFSEKYRGDQALTKLPSGKAGTMVLVHFDLWHRASLNRTNIDRYMLKFQFIRLEQPAYPTWNHRNPAFLLPEASHSLPDQTPIWRDIWHWMLGQPEGNREHVEPAAGEVESLRLLLGGADEQAALNAAYALGKAGTSGISALLHDLQAPDHDVALRSAYGLSASGAPAVAGLLEVLAGGDAKCAGYAAFALGMIGRTAQLAVPALAEAVEHESPWVRRNAIEALGMIRQPARDVIPALIKALKQEESEGNGDQGNQPGKQKYIKHKVRYAAALSLLRVGNLQEAAIAVGALRDALEDEDRYVKAYACEALTYIKSDEAVATLIRFFRKSRWCPVTSKENGY